MKKIIKRSIGYTIGSKLCFNLLRFINRKKLIIIYYHRVIKKEDLVNITPKNLCIDNESFEKQMKFLSQFYNPMNERDIILAMEGKGKTPEYPIWVTFDDGYKDNYENAYPIFKKYKIPATFFITTGFINKQVIPCADYIHTAVKMTNLREIKLCLNKKEYNFSLDTEEHKNTTIKKLLAISEDNNIKKNIYLKELLDAFKIPLGDISNLFMSWDEIQEMSNNGFSIGAHTVNHSILSALSEQEITKEISESKYEIENKLSANIYSFAYPRGKGTDFDDRTCFPILQSCGFKLGVTTIGGSNNLVLNKNCFNLKRMGVSYGESLDFFKVKVGTGSFWQL